jgi:hypothetical protein
MEVERDNEEGCLPSQLYAKYKERYDRVAYNILDHGSELQNLLSSLSQQQL